MSVSSGKTHAYEAAITHYWLALEVGALASFQINVLRISKMIVSCRRLVGLWTVLYFFNLANRWLLCVAHLWELEDWFASLTRRTHSRKWQRIQISYNNMLVILQHLHPVVLFLCQLILGCLFFLQMAYLVLDEAHNSVFILMCQRCIISYIQRK